MNTYEMIVLKLEDAVAGGLPLSKALQEIDTEILRPKDGSGWDYVPPGIFQSLSACAAQRETQKD
jgi:hypothetical protein